MENADINRLFPLSGGLGKDTIYSAMQNFCVNEHGPGWKATPKYFLLTGLQFTDLKGNTQIKFEVQGAPLLDISNKEKRENRGIVPKLGPDDKAEEFKVFQSYFFVHGFWVFQCEKIKPAPDDKPRAYALNLP